jgi:hypothetical protein
MLAGERTVRLPLAVAAPRKVAAKIDPRMGS